MDGLDMLGGDEVAVFGLPWGTDAASVGSRFNGLTADTLEHGVLVYDLYAVAMRLVDEHAFCPAALRGSHGELANTVEFRFQDGGLVAVLVHFSNSFESLGHSPDGLSDMAMAGFARAEFQGFLADLAARYGAPQLFSESSMRRGNKHVVASSLYVRQAAGTLHVSCGYDHNGVIGDMRYLAPAANLAGF